MCRTSILREYGIVFVGVDVRITRVKMIDRWFLVFLFIYVCINVSICMCL